MDGLDPFLVVEVVHDDVALEVCSDGVGELASQGLLHQPGGDRVDVGVVCMGGPECGE